MANPFLLRILENEFSFRGSMERATKEGDERYVEEIHSGVLYDSGDYASFRLCLEFVETRAHLGKTVFLRGVGGEVVLLEGILGDVE